MPLGSHRYVAVVALALFAVGYTRGVVSNGSGFVAANVLDFDVVYCGAKVALAHRDPYRVEPLRSCELAVEPSREPRWNVTPMAQPGYAIALLAPFAFLPYAVAKSAWMIALAAALLVCAWSMARVTRLPFVLVLALFAPSLGVLNLRYGEAVPLAVAALCLGALALERNRPHLAGALAALAMLEPHIGLGAVIGVAVLQPRARPAVATGVVLLGALSLAFLGLAENLEYFTTFLPLQVAAELFAVDQYSLTHVLALAGLPESLAARLGSLEYAAAIVAGVVAARHVQQRAARPSAAMLVPVVPAMLGGVFVHDVEIAAALPGALLVASLDLPGVALARAGFIALVYPWDLFLNANKEVELATLVATAAAVLAFARGASSVQRVALAIAVPLLCGIGSQIAGHGTLPPSAYVPQPERVPPDAPSPLIWGMQVRSDGTSTEVPQTLLVKLPWWLGLSAVTLAALRLPRVRGGISGAVTATNPAGSPRSSLL